MSKKYHVLIMGASYGSLLGAKLLLAGHNVKLICLPAEAELIGREGIRVRLPVKGRSAPVEIDSRKLPGRLTAGGPAGVEPGGLAPDLGEDLLGDLLRLARIPQHAPGDAEDRGGELVVDRGERDLVTARHPPNAGLQVVHAPLNLPEPGPPGHAHRRPRAARCGEQRARGEHHTPRFGAERPADWT